MKQQKETEKKLSGIVFSPGSERNLISICLKDNDKLLEAENEGLYPEHFQIPGHQKVFMAMNYLQSKKIKVEPMAIMEVLQGKTKEDVEELGGLEYLLTLNSSLVPVENLKIFVEKIKQSYTRKMLVSMAESTMEFMTSDRAEVLNPSELIAFVDSQVADIGVNSQEVEEVYKMGKETEEILKQRAETPSVVPGLEVGWELYDKLTNGAQPGDLIIVAAPSKTGKSVTLTNWATNLSIRGKLPILYVDTEMNSREQEDRILANLTGIPHSEIVSGMYVMDTQYGTAEDKIRILDEARAQLDMGGYYHIYMPQFTIEKVTALARKFQKQYGIVAVFFDYIKIPSNQADFRSSQEYQKLGFFTSGLKDLAGILQIPVFSACQTNRANAGTNEDPDESDIGGSYRILQLASKLMFLYNKSEEEIAKEGIQNGNQKLFIKWQRNGESNCPPINIMFNKPIIQQKEAN
jgi:replicative DNA helicase